MQYQGGVAESRQRQLEDFLTPFIHCGFARVDIASGLPVSRMPADTAGHIDSCDHCKRQLAGINRLN